MAEAVLSVGGRRYTLNCREGDQPRLEALAAMVDAKAEDAARSLGGLNEPRQLLLASLLLADELAEARSATAAAPGADLARAVDAIAARLETLADRLENGAASP